jgi:DNA mismatch endonuclease, patch repair protein
MSQVRGRNTRFELTMMRWLSSSLYPLGYRYRKHYRAAKGTPDIVFVRQRIAVFFDSDFWHGRNYLRLKSRMSLFWRAKIERNMQRDREVDRSLRNGGWAVMRFGESEIKRDPIKVVEKIRKQLEKSEPRDPHTRFRQTPRSRSPNPTAIRRAAPAPRTSR